VLKASSGKCVERCGGFVSTEAEAPLQNRIGVIGGERMGILVRGKVSTKFYPREVNDLLKQRNKSNRAQTSMSDHFYSQRVGW